MQMLDNKLGRMLDGQDDSWSQLVEFIKKDGDNEAVCTRSVPAELTVCTGRCLSDATV